MIKQIHKNIVRNLLLQNKSPEEISNIYLLKNQLTQNEITQLIKECSKELKPIPQKEVTTTELKQDNPIDFKITPEQKKLLELKNGRLIHILKNGGLDEQEIKERVEQSMKPDIIRITDIEPPPVEKRAKKSFGFVLLKTCNLTCEFCIWDSYKRDNKMMVSPEFFEETVIKLKKEGYDSCGLIGGEVGLHPKFKEIINILVKHGISFTFVTNCRRWEMYKFLIEDEKIKKYFDSLSVSLDGTEKTHDSFRRTGTYKKVMEALEYFSKHGKIPSIKMILRNDNYQDIMHVFRIAKKFKSSLETLDVVRSPKNALTDENLNDIEKIISDNQEELNTYKEGFKIQNLRNLNGDAEHIWSCPQFFSRELVIYPDGKVGYCCSGLVDDVPVGNIKTDSVKTLLEKRMEMSLYLIENSYPLLSHELPFCARDSCAICRQLLGSKI